MNQEYILIITYLWFMMKHHDYLNGKQKTLYTMISFVSYDFF